MTPADFLIFREAAISRYADAQVAIAAMDAAPEDVISVDTQADAFAEATFLRFFVAYETDLEALFLHYVTGGFTVQGRGAPTYLRLTDEVAARKLTRAGYPFLSWAKPEKIRETANNYIENGWPISDMLASKAQTLADCEKLRNRIAHNSLEALAGFNAVQRNMLHTERLFKITPGQFLRIRSRRLRQLHIGFYFAAMHETLMAICDPPL